MPLFSIEESGISFITVLLTLILPGWIKSARQRKLKKFTTMKDVKLYALNPAYYFRKEGNRIYLLSRSCCGKNTTANLEWRSIVHPAYAMILSFFSMPTSLKDGVEKVQEFLDVSYETALELIGKFICNSEEMHSEYTGQINNFPKEVIIETGSAYIPHTFRIIDIRQTSLNMKNWK